MKQKLLFLILLLSAAVSAVASDTTAVADTNSPGPTAAAKYASVIDQRSAKIVQSLGLADTNTAARVHALIMGQYRSLNEWHNTFDPQIKAARRDPVATAKIKDSLKQLHDAYLAGLATCLTPAQIEQVKDDMTYGKVQFTFAGYCSQYPDLSETNKQAVLRMLKEAREEAMDCGSAKEKTAVFLRYKGRINNYLSKQGIGMAKKP